MSYQPAALSELAKTFERLQRKCGMNGAADPDDTIRHLDPAELREVAVAMYEMARTCAENLDEADLENSPPEQRMEDFKFGEDREMSVLIPTLLSLPEQNAINVDQPSSDDGDDGEGSASTETPSFRMSRSARSSVSIDGYECINDFMIIDQIGKGQFGRVMLAVKDGEDEPVAIKIVPRTKIVAKRVAMSPMQSPKRMPMSPMSSPKKLLDMGSPSSSISGSPTGRVPLVLNGGELSGPAADSPSSVSETPSDEASPLASLIRGNTLGSQKSTDSSCPPLQSAPFSGTSTLDIEALQREVAIMKKLCHKNIVALHECIDDEEEGNLYLVMQYVDRGPIFQIDEEGNCPVMELSKVRHYLRQIISGLSYLERNDVLHMDIKPDNILLNSDDVVFLADFGMSEMIDHDGNDMEASGVFSPGPGAGRSLDSGRRARPAQRGTPAFMSPEMCLGHEFEITSATDVWSLGVTLYCMLVGCLPFKGRSWRETTKLIVEEEPNIPHELDPTWTDLLLGMLNKDPSERSTLAALRRHPLIQCQKTGSVVDNMQSSFSVSMSARDMLLTPRDHHIEISNADVQGAITALRNRRTVMAPKRHFTGTRFNTPSSPSMSLNFMSPVMAYTKPDVFNAHGNRPPLSPGSGTGSNHNHFGSNRDSQTSLLSDSWATRPTGLQRNATSPDLTSTDGNRYEPPLALLSPTRTHQKPVMRKSNTSPNLLVG